MKEFILFYLLAFSLFYTSYAQEEEEDAEDFYPKDSLVIQDDEDFESLFQNEKNLFVEFYAPWCPHCKTLKPEIIKLAEMLKDMNIKVVAIDATKHVELSQQFDIQGFPDLKFFINGQPIDYQGERTYQAMYDFVSRRMGPAIVDINSQEELNNFKNKNDVSIIGYFDDDIDSMISTYYNTLAESMRDEASFGIIKDNSLAIKINLLEKQNSMKLYGHNDKEIIYNIPKIENESNTTPLDDMEKFVIENLLPLVGEITGDNYHRYLDRELPIFWIFTNPDKKDLNDQFINIATNAASNDNILNKVLFVHLDGQEHESHAQFYGLDTTDLPSGVFVDDIKQEKYPFQLEDGKNMNIKDLNIFINDILNGKLKPFIRSAEPLEEQKGDVIEVVRKNFDDLITNNKNDILIMFYAPWCHHCQALHPIYEKLATLLKPVDGIMLAKMDATTNDVPMIFDVEGFPTLYLLKADDKDEPLQTTERSFEGLLSFLEKETKSIVSQRISILSKYNTIANFASNLPDISTEIFKLLDLVGKQANEINDLKLKLGIEPEELEEEPNMGSDEEFGMPPEGFGQEEDDESYRQEL